MRLHMAPCGTARDQAFGQGLNVLQDAGSPEIGRNRPSVVTDLGIRFPWDESTSRGFTEESLRTSLHRLLVSTHENEPDTVLIDELGICRGSARVDLAVVNGEFHGYEIKSDRDSLRRLNIQADLYSRVFDRVTLVCSDRHVSQALAIVPSWWGVLRIVPGTQDPIFKRVRRGRKNPNRDIRALAELLWLEEAVVLLSKRRAIRGMRGRPRADLWDRVCELFKKDELAAAVRAHLKATAVKRGRPARQS